MDLDFQPENLPPKPASRQGGPEKGAMPPTPQPAPASSQPVSMVNPQPKAPDIPPPASVEPHPGMIPNAPHKKSILPLIIIGAVVVIILVAALILIIRSRQSQITDTTSSVPSTSVPTFNDQSSLGATDSSSETTTLPSSSTATGRDAKRKEDVRKISTLLAAYYADNQSYPAAPDLDKLNASNSVVGKALVPKYTSKLPVDPLDPDFFYGYTSKDGQTYELSARLESTTDSEATLVGSKYLFVIKK